MIDAGPPLSLASEVDWADWDQALSGFSGATGLCISGYDVAGVRRVGPHLSSRVASFLKARGAWEEGGAASGIELHLIDAVLKTNAPANHTVEDTLTVIAVPLTSRPESNAPSGVLIFGWALTGFSSSLECQRIASTMRVDGGGLWAAARMESPVPASRLTMSMQLLQTLVHSTARHTQALATIEELARIREVFLASVSHELRTPLTAILLRLERLLRSELDDPAWIRDSLAHVKRHASEEARLVEDLIDAARTRTGQLTVHRQPTALPAILEAAAAAVGPAALIKGVTLDLSPFDQVSQCEVLADAHRLKQAFWNLLSNAVKFTPEGGFVSVRAQSENDWCRVTVSDTGRGIEAAMLPLVFEPFSRQRQGNAQGLGLGLSIARQIIELHDGKITVQSEGLGHGATFEVVLPRHAERRTRRSGAAADGAAVASPSAGRSAQ